MIAARMMGTARSCSIRPGGARRAGRRRALRRAATTNPRRSTSSPRCCAVVTTEFENLPAAALERLAPTRRRPAGGAVAIAQDRISEKRFLDASAPDGAVRGRRGRRLRCPAILKTARLGYDGKGQRTVERRRRDGRAGDSRAVHPRDARRARRELSVIVARTGRRQRGRLPGRREPPRRRHPRPHRRPGAV